MLIVFGGLPGVGKTTIARELARRTGAVHLRIDSIEQTIRDSGTAIDPMTDLGYRIAYAVAEDNLRLGRTVIADCVNPLRITRDAWFDVARRARVHSLEIEITCSDLEIHRARVENRVADVPGLTLPAWPDVVSREYEPWRRAHLVIDTATSTVGESVDRIGTIIAEKP